MGQGRGTGCAGHLSPLTRPPRGRPPGGWEAETWPVPTACPQRAWEEAGQQVVGQLGPRPASTHFYWSGETRPGPSWPQFLYL